MVLNDDEITMEAQPNAVPFTTSTLQQLVRFLFGHSDSLPFAAVLLWSIVK